MPNWCNNTVEINHKDPAKMYALVEAVNAGKFCNFAIPVPESLHIIAGCAGSDDSPEQIALIEAQNKNIAEHGYKDWYDFCTSRWGTKWDVSFDSIERVNPNTVQASFDSAWAPPTVAYEKLIELGFYVKAYYYEPGMAFCGCWEGDTENGFFDDYAEYSGETSKTVREAIGAELDDMFGISESMAQWEEENADE